MTNEYKPLARLHYLDSLRGLAALYVIMYHTLLVSSAPVRLTPGLDQFFNFGGTGVFLFFVISGFSLSMTMPRHEATGRPVLSYAISRVFRIAPLFYLVLAVLMIRGLVLGYGLYPKTLLANVTFLFNLFPEKQEGIVPASWTIGVEMLFYAMFPFIFAMKLRTQIVVACVAQGVFVLMRLKLPTTYTYWTIVGWVPIFLIGMWSYRVLRYLNGALERKRLAGGGMIMGALLVLAACALPADSAHVVADRIPIALAYGLLVIGLGLQRPGTFSFKPLLFLGKVSYSAYLIHALVINSLDAMMIRAFGDLPADGVFVARCAVVLVIALPAAALLTRYFERPIETQGKRLLRWFSDRALMVGADR